MLLLSNNKFLKYLPRIIPGFPIILKNQAEIFQAEKSGDLSYGMLDAPDQPRLPSRIRYAVSLLYEHPDASGQHLFFNFKEKTSYPFSKERLAERQDTWEKLNNVLQQLKLMDEKSSALLRYFASKQSNVADLEPQARIELITLVLHQWNDKVQIDKKYLACLDIFMQAKEHMLKSILFPNRAEFDKAKKYMESQVNADPLLYHHAWGIGITLWKGVRKLHDELDKPEFKKMLKNGEWSPAAFLVQHQSSPKAAYRVTARATNLGGVLPYQVGRGRLVILSTLAAAEDSAGLFLNVCCASNFIMDLLTLLVDRARPGLREQAAGQQCPYKKTIQRPLY